MIQHVKPVVITIGAIAGLMEIAAFQASATPVDWLVANAGLFTAIGGGIMGYAALRARAEQNRDDIKSLKDDKADKGEISGMQRQLERIERAIEALNERIDGLMKEGR